MSNITVVLKDLRVPTLRCTYCGFWALYAIFKGSKHTAIGTVVAALTISSCDHSRESGAGHWPQIVSQLDLHSRSLYRNLPVSLRVLKTADCCRLLVALNDRGPHQRACECNMPAAVDGHLWTGSLLLRQTWYLSCRPCSSTETRVGTVADFLSHSAIVGFISGPATIKGLQLWTGSLLRQDGRDIYVACGV